MNMIVTHLSRALCLTTALLCTALTSLDARSFGSFGSDSDSFGNGLEAWDHVRRPVSNPTLFDLPVAQTYIKPLFLYHVLPDNIRTTLGDVPAGGEVLLYAVQFQYAFTDSLALVALKDGFVDFRADNTLADTDGFANLSAGLKWTFFQKPEEGSAAALRLMYEIPIGEDEVLQGQGSGLIIPSLDLMQIVGPAQFASTIGAEVPIDGDDESTMLFLSGHFSYEVLPRFAPLVELNYRRVLGEGDGGSRFPLHAGGAVPALATFEGGDLFNFGASNGSTNPDFLSFALGFRYRVLDWAELGFAWERPITDREESVMEQRFHVDAVIHF
ncbi:MAG: hypothetical protein ACFB20_07260 [Opitutales bacterium]